jgi:hypothetical protein
MRKASRDGATEIGKVWFSRSVVNNRIHRKG